MHSPQYLSPDVSPMPGRRRLSFLEKIKERTGSELSLVVEAFRQQGSVSPGGDRGNPTSTSTPALTAAPSLKLKGHRRRKVKSTWAAMQPSNFYRVLHTGEYFCVGLL